MVYFSSIKGLGLTNFNIISCFFIYTGQECKPKDSDRCLQRSRYWNHGHTCRSNTHYCTSYGKDMKRCCPESCNSGAFTEAQCEADNSIGTCIYPNKAQCHTRKLQISIRTKLKPPKEFNIISNCFHILLKFCFIFLAIEATCKDGITNQGEIGTDCGGPCPPCGKYSENYQIIQK